MILEIHNHPWFLDVLAASGVGWVFGLFRGFRTTRDFYARNGLNPPNAVVVFSDLFIFVVVGAYFGTGIFDPQDFKEAVFAGLSWTVGLRTIVESGATPDGDGRDNDGP